MTISFIRSKYAHGATGPILQMGKQTQRHPAASPRSLSWLLQRAGLVPSLMSTVLKLGGRTVSGTQGGMPGDPSGILGKPRINTMYLLKNETYSKTQGTVCL